MQGLTHQYYMQRALEQARCGEGRTAPNPPVGAVIVRDGAIVGEGFHPKAGEPHAEVFALRQAAELAQGADVYVTLEPCSHQGRTGPCADALIEAGVARVFIGVLDPNPRVSGRGAEKLDLAGVEVRIGIEEQACQELINPFTRFISSGMPFTIYKTAMTLDGKTATASGDSKWISGERSRLHVHRLRNRVEAIMVGIETVLADDPLLTTRLDGEGGRDPLRVVVDSQLRMPADAAMLQHESTAWTLIATTVDDAEKIRRLQQAGAEVMRFPAIDGRVSLPHLWHELGKRDVQRLLLEGGATLAGAALRADLIDQLQVYVAPKLVGGAAEYGIFAGEGVQLLNDAIPLKNLRFEPSGEDVLLTGEVVRCSRD